MNLCLWRTRPAREQRPRPPPGRRDAPLRSAGPLRRQAAWVDAIERIVADIAEEIHVAGRKAAGGFA